MSALLATFFVFLGLKLSGTVDWPWIGVFAPLMAEVVVDLGLLLALIASALFLGASK